MDKYINKKSIDQLIKDSNIETIFEDMLGKH